MSEPVSYAFQMRVTAESFLEIAKKHQLGYPEINLIEGGVILYDAVSKIGQGGMLYVSRNHKDHIYHYAIPCDKIAFISVMEGFTP